MTSLAQDRPAIGMCFDRGFPASAVVEFAERLETIGADQLWVIEDCFYTAGVSLAAAALTATRRLHVGLGILPAVARNPAVTAMEIATLCGLAPGRVIAGIGHGVQEWMGQMGVRPRSPLTALEEVLVAVRSLLSGDEVSCSGEYVSLDRVRLEHPPSPVPPVLAGVRGPKSLAVAGRAADGIVLAELSGPTAVRVAIAQAAPSGPFSVAVLSPLCVASDRATAYRAMSPVLAGLLADPTPALRCLPFFEDLTEHFARRGAEGLATMPSDWWAEMGAIGTIDDALAHITALSAAGATSVALFPSPDLSVARAQLDDVATIVRG